MFILIRLTQHVSGIIMPIIRRTDYVNKCMWSMSGCVGSSRTELGHEQSALCESWYTYTNFHTVHSVRFQRSARLLPTQSGILHMQLFT